MINELFKTPTLILVHFSLFLQTVWVCLSQIYVKTASAEEKATHVLSSVDFECNQNGENLFKTIITGDEF